MKLDILAIGVHPDDVELSCSGTLLLQASLGYSFGLLDLTRGELGTRGSAELRTQEAMKAADILGAAVREQLTLADGFFTLSPENWLPVVSAIRKYQPEIVLCNAPDDRHPDHGRAAKLVADACFYSGLPKIETKSEQGDLQEKWRPKSVFHYIQDKTLEPDFVVDITEFYPQKLESILAYQSQFYDPNSPEPHTPISGKDFIDFIEAKNRVYARLIQAEFAEGFIASRIPGVKNLFDLT